MFPVRLKRLAAGHRYPVLAYLVLVAWPLHAQSPSVPPPITATPLNSGKTALDDYIAQPDENYRWKLVSKRAVPGAVVYVIDLVSQSWLRPGEVDRNVWQHWLTIVKPETVKVDTGLLFIVGGRNGQDPPASADERTLRLALATQSVVAQLGMVPNQPLEFHGDGQPRFEDDLIGYTWSHYLETGDARWPARLPMVKAAVKAMDTIQAFLASDEAGEVYVKNFVVAGGSKRGWTTWMTAAVDARVKAIIPIVIDVLNANVSMQHHYSAYGFWAPAIGDYVRHKITHRRHHPRYAKLLQLVDPFAYRDRFTMPKCIINATGDQFFLPDSSQFYFDELPGEKHLCYVPNADHSLNDTNAVDTLISFHYAICHGLTRPKFSWSYHDDATLRVVTEDKPTQVLLWQATNPNARDFRVQTIGRAFKASELGPDDQRTYVAKVQPPARGWKAYFVQLTYDIGAPTPLRLTTPVRVLPDILPFADQPPPTIEAP